MEGQKFLTDKELAIVSAAAYVFREEINLKLKLLS